jgi:hypothetical protein
MMAVMSRSSDEFGRPMRRTMTEDEVRGVRAAVIVGVRDSLENAYKGLGVLALIILGLMALSVASSSSSAGVFRGLGIIVLVPAVIIGTPLLILSIIVLRRLLALRGLRQLVVCGEQGPVDIICTV